MEDHDFMAIEFDLDGEPIAYAAINDEDDDGYGDAARLLIDCELLEDNELNFEEE